MAANRQLADPNKRLGPGSEPGPAVPDWYAERMRYPYRRDQRWGDTTQIEIDPAQPLPVVSEGQHLVEAREMPRPWLFEWLIVRVTPAVPGDLSTVVFEIVQGVGSHQYGWRFEVPLIAPQLRGSIFLSSGPFDVKPQVESAFLNPLVLSKRRVFVSGWVAPFTQEALG